MRGILKTGNFSGRASRSEFWWFAPLGLALPIVIGRYSPPEVTTFSSFVVKLGLVLVGCLPIMSAATRRFQDTGSHAIELWVGVKPTVMVAVTGWILMFGLFAVSTIVYLLLGLLILMPALLFLIPYALLAPGMLGMTIGQLLTPSQPGSNRYGPDPRGAGP